MHRFRPHRPLLERAACVVCHGGMGISQKALAAAVPVCAGPFGRDQFEVARRVDVAAAGVRLPAGRLNPWRLRRAIEAAIARRAGAQALAAVFRASPGPAGAAPSSSRCLIVGTMPAQVKLHSPRSRQQSSTSATPSIAGLRDFRAQPRSDGDAGPRPFGA